jgi:DNA polymerase I-like protein with 3'-5' exonuclease and polymerase domains
MLNEERTPLILNPPPNITRVVDDESVASLCSFLSTHKEYGWDTETTVVNDFYWRRVRTIQFGDSKEQYVIDLKEFCDGSSDILYDCQGNYGKNLDKAPRLQDLLNKLVPFVCSHEITKVGVNLAFEYQCFYWNFGIRTNGFYDCMMVEKCIYSGLGGQASLKNYGFYSMEEMLGRYFYKSIDKTLQTSFNLDDELSDAQYEYAALDTRIPLAIKAVQNLITAGWLPGALRDAGYPEKAKLLTELDQLLLGDNLREICQIENDAIGSFVDMHVHGERIDREKWLERVAKRKIRFTEVLHELDEYFLPLVGSKTESISQEEVDTLEAAWKALTAPSQKEIEINLIIKATLREQKKTGIVDLNCASLEEKLVTLEEKRKENKENLKKKHGELRKKRTQILKLIDQCEGDALINYNSGAQLLKVLVENEPRLVIKEKGQDKKFTGKTRPAIDSLDDEVMEKWKLIVPILGKIQEYHGLAKEIGTYGDAWAQEWKTKPSKEEGWLHPGDGRLHSEFNQYDAETGRSSSSKPNGQNLPQDTEVRSCFIADPPDESIRISDCCESETEWNGSAYWCNKCGQTCTTHAEEYVIITDDMSGAELRIIAEAADDARWIEAFSRDEDVHSMGAELLYEVEWPKEALPDCEYFKLNATGTPQRKKCNCPLHRARRGDNKSTNFLLAYGGGPGKLATEIKKTLAQAKVLMALHEQKNPNIWAYLEKSGTDAMQKQKAFDLYGRRRILPVPTRARALENCKEYNEDKLRLPIADCEKNVETFLIIKKRKPNAGEMYELSHRQPNANEIGRSYYQMSNGSKRQGKNHAIQGTNATIAKLAMSSAVDANGIPYLWNTLPLYKAKLLKFVHDELVVQCPKRFGKIVAELISDAFKRAAAVKMHKVEMKSEFHIGNCWEK